MKILHIIDSEGFYGAEAVIINLVMEQKENGHKPKILNLRRCEPSEQSLESESTKMGLDFFIIPLRFGFNIIGAFRIVQFAIANGFEIIHSHGYKSNILLGLMPKMIRKLPMITTLHGWTSTKKFTKIWFYEQLDLISLKFIDSVVLVNQKMLSLSMLKKYKLKNLSVINNGIPLINFNNSGQPMDDKILSFCRHPFVIGSIGRLSKEKGFEYLIASLNALVQEGIDVRLIIIGEGSERGSLEAMVEQICLKERVLMPGYLKYARNYIPFFKAFVISSLTEGLPITLLEAMQARVPIVATKVGGIPEVLHNGKAGLLVDPCNVKSLVDAIEICYSNKNLVKELTLNGYEIATNDYSSNKMSSGYFKVYESVLCQHN